LGRLALSPSPFGPSEASTSGDGTPGATQAGEGTQEAPKGELGASDAAPKTAEVIVNGKPYIWTEGAGLDTAAAWELRGWIVRLAGSRICFADFQELEAAGLLGAVKACRTFAPGRGAGYLRWATLDIKNEMGKVIRGEKRTAHFDDDGAIENIAAPEDEAGAAKVLAMQILERLAPADRKILARRYGLGGGPPQSAAELAAADGVSHSAIINRTNKALGRARAALGIGLPGGGTFDRLGGFAQGAAQGTAQELPLAEASRAS